MEIVTNISKLAPPGRPVGVYGVLSGRIHPHRLLSPILVLGFYVISTNFNDETASRLFLQVNTLGGSAGLGSWVDFAPNFGSTGVTWKT